MYRNKKNYIKILVNEPTWPTKATQSIKKEFFTSTNILYLLRKPIVHAQKKNFLYLKKSKKDKQKTKNKTKHLLHKPEEIKFSKQK